MSSPANSTDRLGSLHPQMLKAPSPVDPQKLGEDAKREIGQAFEWAIDQARSTKGALATDREFLLALLQMEEGVEVKTLVTMRRIV